MTTLSSKEKTAGVIVRLEPAGDDAAAGNHTWKMTVNTDKEKGYSTRVTTQGH